MIKLQLLEMVNQKYLERLAEWLEIDIKSDWTQKALAAAVYEKIKPFNVHT